MSEWGWWTGAATLTLVRQENGRAGPRWLRWINRPILISWLWRSLAPRQERGLGMWVTGQRHWGPGYLSYAAKTCFGVLGGHGTWEDGGRRRRRRRRAASKDTTETMTKRERETRRDETRRDKMNEGLPGLGALDCGEGLVHSLAMVWLYFSQRDMG